VSLTPAQQQTLLATLPPAQRQLLLNLVRQQAALSAAAAAAGKGPAAPTAGIRPPVTAGALGAGIRPPGAGAGQLLPGLGTPGGNPNAMAAAAAAAVAAARAGSLPRPGQVPGAAGAGVRPPPALQGLLGQPGLTLGGTGGVPQLDLSTPSGSAPAATNQQQQSKGQGANKGGK
jgi:hypothetical protein